MRNMNECCECDKPFVETETCSGSLCPDCQEKLIIDKGKLYLNVEDED